MSLKGKKSKTPCDLNSRSSVAGKKKSKRKWICLQKRCTTSTGTDRFLLYSLLLGEKMVYYGFFVCVFYESSSTKKKEKEGERVPN